MPHRLISQQTLLEHEVVARLSDALRTAIGWSHHGGVTRKLESVRFLAESFRRHLDRMLDLEEHGGYLDLLSETHPQYEETLAGFRREHVQFRARFDAALEHLGHSREVNQLELDAILDEFTNLLDEIDLHNKQETHLLQTVMLQPAPDNPVG